VNLNATLDVRSARLDATTLGHYGQALTNAESPPLAGDGLSSTQYTKECNVEHITDQWR